MRERERVTQPEGGRLMTKQASKEDADINAVLRRWLVHRGPLPGNGQEPRYGDFSGVGDFHSALERVRTAESEFAELPAKVRGRCLNDPGEFLAIVFDPARAEELDELRKLGLVEERIPQTVRLSDDQVAGLASKLTERVASEDAAGKAKPTG